MQKEPGKVLGFEIYVTITFCMIKNDTVLLADILENLISNCLEIYKPDLLTSTWFGVVGMVEEN